MSRPCPKCGHEEYLLIPGKDRGVNCARCGFFFWLPKPENEKRLKSRPNASLALGKKYSPGYCEDCRMPEADVYAAGMHLHGHHVIELGEPGCTDERSNILVLCTGCHEGVHVRRRYVGRLYDRRKSKDAA